MPLRIHPAFAPALQTHGFTVVGPGESSFYFHPAYCCSSCSPHAKPRASARRERVVVQRPAGMSRKQAKHIIASVVGEACKRPGYHP